MRLVKKVKMQSGCTTVARLDVMITLQDDLLEKVICRGDVMIFDLTLKPEAVRLLAERQKAEGQKEEGQKDVRQGDFKHEFEWTDRVA